MKKLFLVSVLLVGVTATGLAAEWKLDKAHSQITFSIKHMVISEVAGRFGDFDVTVTSSKDDFTDATIEAVIRVNSISTGVERRDNHLKSDDFFNAEKFPEIRFKSTSIEKTGENTYKIHGDLTIRDVTKRVTFDAILNGVLKMGDQVRAGWKAILVVNRFDYGLKWNRAIETGGLIAGDMVTITVNIEITR